MKKSAIASAVLVGMGATGVASAATMTSAEFVMFDPAGDLVVNGCAGCVNGVDVTVTGTIGNGVWSVASTETFFGANWSAKAGTTFGPGTYTITTNPPSGGPLYSSVVVAEGQVGGHILFDWGGTNSATGCGVAECNLDVINVWDVETVGDVTTYISTDFAVNRANAAQTKSTVLGPDGIPGVQIQDTSTFQNFNPNFDFCTGGTAAECSLPGPNLGNPIPVPAAVWLFGSGLLGLVGVARRKKSA